VPGNTGGHPPAHVDEARLGRCRETCRARLRNRLSWSFSRASSVVASSGRVCSKPHGAAAVDGSGPTFPHGGVGDLSGGPDQQHRAAALCRPIRICALSFQPARSVAARRRPYPRVKEAHGSELDHPHRWHPVQRTPALDRGRAAPGASPLGWTQVDLARAIKVTPVSISSFETGRTTRLRPRNERRILAALTERGIDVEGSAIRLRGRRQAAAG
jgi:hypothetical protein